MNAHTYEISMFVACLFVLCRLQIEEMLSDFSLQIMMQKVPFGIEVP